MTFLERQMARSSTAARRHMQANALTDLVKRWEADGVISGADSTALLRYLNAFNAPRPKRPRANNICMTVCARCTEMGMVPGGKIRIL